MGNTFERHKGATVVSSALDHIFCSNPDLLSNFGNLPVSLSDHSLIYCSIPNENGIKKESQKRITYRQKIKDESLFLHDLAMQPWELLADLDDPTEQLAKFYCLFNEIYDKHSPTKSKLIRNRSKGFRLSDHTKSLIKRKETAFRRLKKNSNPEDYSCLRAEYNKLRNMVTLAVQNEEKQYLSDLAQTVHGHNPWKAIKTVLGQSSSSTPQKIQKDGDLITDHKQIADELNQSFKLKISDIKQSLQKEQKDDPFKKLEEHISKLNSSESGSNLLKFGLKTANDFEIKKTLLKLKNTNPGADELPMHVLKACISVISSPLSWIYNTSIMTGIFPEQLKVAKVIPIHKNKGSKLDPSCYRPISILPALSKLFEAISEKQIRKFVEENHILPQHQNGFRTKRSTGNAIQSILNKLEKAKKRSYIAACSSMDLSAAFDSIESEILCGKLKILGFDNLSVKWISSYMCDRKQYIEINGIKSELIKLIYGVPQGSILGPLLYIIATCDVHLWLSDPNIESYADDSYNIILAKTSKDLVEKLQLNSEEMSLFMITNGLKMNSSKTDLMVVRPTRGNSDTISVKVGQDVVAEKKTVNILGLKFTNDLTWNNYLQELIRDLNSKIGLLYRIRNKLHTRDLVTIADGLILSKIRYCISSYCSPRLTESDPQNWILTQLQTIQNNTMRTIFKKKLVDKVPIKDLIHSCNWLSINRTTIHNILIEAWKILMFELNSDIVNDISQDYVRDTRAASRGDFNPDPLFSSKFVKTAAFLLNNDLFRELKHCTSVSKAKMIVRSGLDNFPL